MTKKYALHTIDNLVDYAQYYFRADRKEDAIQLLNSASLILYSADDKSEEFDNRLSNIHELAQDIVDQTTARFQADFERKFFCFQ